MLEASPTANDLMTMPLANDGDDLGDSKEGFQCSGYPERICVNWRKDIYLNCEKGSWVEHSCPGGQNCKGQGKCEAS